MTTELFAERDFRWRSDEITRIESFSDAVFGFAVTLLVVSLEVPSSYHDLIAAMAKFPAFAVCFALLAHIWFAHCRYFRRYALQTPLAIALRTRLAAPSTAQRPAGGTAGSSASESRGAPASS